MFEGIKQSISKLLDTVVKSEFSSKELDSILLDFKFALLENDVALSVAEAICEDVKTKLVGKEVKRFGDKQAVVEEVLKASLQNILTTEHKVDLIELASKKRITKEPFVVIFLGINGTGKTTTIGKVANLFLKKGFSAVLAGGDTFRAGSIEQLEGHGKRLGVKVIKGSYGGDAAAVVFDAVNHARSNGINVVLVDTAGRMQTNKNLMEEIRKIVRIGKPDLILFVGDALTGNDAVEQASEFCKVIEFDASILTKVDADAKGGAAVSIAYLTKKPTIFLGVGQNYDDLVPFEPNFLVSKILD